MSTILMTEEVWANSQLSIARYYGGIKFDGHEYVIVDKLGRDLHECSYIAMKEGRQKAIEPGEPADLIRKDFCRLYRSLGRDKFIEILTAHPEIDSPKKMRDIIKEDEK